MLFWRIDGDLPVKYETGKREGPKENEFFLSEANFFLQPLFYI